MKAASPPRPLALSSEARFLRSVYFVAVPNSSRKNQAWPCPRLVTRSRRQKPQRQPWQNSTDEGSVRFFPGQCSDDRHCVDSLPWNSFSLCWSACWLVLVQGGAAQGTWVHDRFYPLSALIWCCSLCSSPSFQSLHSGSKLADAVDLILNILRRLLSFLRWARFRTKAGSLLLSGCWSLLCSVELSHRAG